MSQVVVQICGDAQCLRDEFQQATASGETFAKNTETKVTGKLRSAFQNLGKSIKNSLLPALAVGAIIRKVGQSIKEAAKIIKEFESALAELSAITGATGKDLDFFKDQAIALGPEFGKSAKDVLNAFKLVGSARPELLKNSEALAAVTKEALLLSQASGDDLEKSVSSLTTIIAQFNEPAERAGDIVNSLAAGSKAGAAPVGQLAETLNKSGIILGQSNATTEQAIALAETLADKQLVGSEAGTQLNAVFNRLNAAEALPKDTIDRLESAGVNLKVLGDTTLPVATRLRELEKIADDGTTQFKLFGEGGQKAGSILLNNVDRFEELTAAVTGTNTAVEQATIASQTLAFQTQKTDATYESLILSLDNGNGVLSESFTAWEKVKQAVLGAAQAYNEGTSASTENVTATNDAIQALSGLGIGFDGLANDAQKLTEELIGINAAFDALIKRNVDARISSAGLIASVIDQKNVVKDLANQFALAEGEDRDRIKTALTQQGSILDALVQEVDARKSASDTSVATKRRFGEEVKVIEEEITEEEKKQIAKRVKANEKEALDKLNLDKEVKELRIKVLKDGLDEELALLELSFEEEKAKFKGNAEALTLLDEQFASDSFAIKEEFAKKEQDLSKATEDKILANKKEALEISEKLAERNADEKVLAATTEGALAQDLADTEVQIEIEKLNAIIALRKAAGEDALDLEIQLAQKKRDIAQQEIQDQAERDKEALDQSVVAAEASINLIGELNTRALEQEQEGIKASLDKEQEALQEKLDNDLISQEQFDISSAELEAKFAKDSAKIKEKQAVADKNAAIFKATIDGLAAVVGAGSITPQAIAIAVANAINIAALIAKPIPAFAKGTDFAQGGWSLVGEEGPELVNLPRGSSVKTASQTVGLLNGNFDAKEHNDYMQNIQSAIYNSYESKGPSMDNVTVKVRGQYDMLMADSAQKSRSLLNKMNGQLEELNKNVNKRGSIFQ